MIKKVLTKWNWIMIQCSITSMLIKKAEKMKWKITKTKWKITKTKWKTMKTKWTITSIFKKKRKKKRNPVKSNKFKMSIIIIKIIIRMIILITIFMKNNKTITRERIVSWWIQKVKKIILIKAWTLTIEVKRWIHLTTKMEMMMSRINKNFKMTLKTSCRMYNKLTITM